MGEAIASIERLKGRGFEIHPKISGYSFNRKPKDNSITGGPIAEISATEYDALLDKISKENGIKSQGHSTYAKGIIFKLNGKDVLDISVNSDINSVSIYSFEVPDGEEFSIKLADYMIETLTTLSKKP